MFGDSRGAVLQQLIRFFHCRAIGLPFIYKDDFYVDFICYVSLFLGVLLARTPRNVVFEFGPGENLSPGVILIPLRLMPQE